MKPFFEQTRCVASIKFGTDGWRAVIAEDFTFANVARVAQATADYWKSEIQKSEIRNLRARTESRCRLRPPVFFRPLRANHRRGFRRQRFSSRPHAGTDAHAVRFLRRQKSGRGRRRDDHRQPQSADFQRLQTQIALRRLQRVRRTCRPSKVFWMQPRQDNIANPQIAKSVNLRSDVRPAHYAAMKRLVDFKLIAKSKLRFAHDALFGVGAGVFEAIACQARPARSRRSTARTTFFSAASVPSRLPKNYALGGAQFAAHPHDICLVTDGDADRIGAHGRARQSPDQPAGHRLLLHHLVRQSRRAAAW